MKLSKQQLTLLLSLVNEKLETTLGDKELLRLEDILELELEKEV